MTNTVNEMLPSAVRTGRAASTRSMQWNDGPDRRDRLVPTNGATTCCCHWMAWLRISTSSTGRPVRMGS
jgi:hypothetical protein